MDGSHGAERRAARDADDPRLGERIAQIPLQHRAREPEHAADEKPENGARQADLGHDQPRRLGTGRQPDALRADEHGGSKGENGRTRQEP